MTTILSRFSFSNSNRTRSRGIVRLTQCQTQVFLSALVNLQISKQVDIDKIVTHCQFSTCVLSQQVLKNRPWSFLTGSLQAFTKTRGVLDDIGSTKSGLLTRTLQRSKHILIATIMSTPKAEKKEDESVGSASKKHTRKSLKDDHHKEVAEARKQFLEMKIDEKRKLYKCKDKFTLLSDVPTWPEYFSANLKDDKDIASWWQRNKTKLEADVNENLNSKISIFRGDITTLEIDAIANAANESLLGGGGVDGAIHAASGSKLLSECELLSGCDPGDAKITCGYKLPAKYVIHTVGPRGEKPEVLENCYKNCLKLLKENNLKSLAFPCISTGIFGYPNLNAAKVAISTIRKFLQEDEYGPQVERIIFCLFMKKDVDIYHEQLQLYFPLDRPADSNESNKSDNEDAVAKSSDTETTKAEKPKKNSKKNKNKK